MKLFLKNIFFIFLNFFNHGLKNKASILMYHSVDDNSAFFTISLKEFERQLKYLKKNNFKVIKLSELFEKLKNKKDISGCVVLTFDDGYEDNYKNVFPLIKKYNFPISVFVATNFIGKEMINSEETILKIISCEQIKEMFDCGLAEFLPHTKGHQNLSTLDERVIQAEIEDSRLDLEKICSSVPKILAFPKGKYNKNVIDLLTSMKYTGAVSVKEGLVCSESFLFDLPRNSIDKTSSFFQFKGKLSRSIDIFNFYKKWIL